MVLEPLMEQFARQAPACVMVRALMEATIEPDELDRRLEAASDHQYTRELLFSTLVDVMSLTVMRARPTVHAALQACRTRIDVSFQAFYGKLARTEPAVSRELVRFTGRKFLAVREHLKIHKPALVPGFRTLVVDGNHLTGTEHRLKVSRFTRSAALPGQALVVYEPDRGLIVDVFPCEDAYAQERRIMPAMIDAARPGDLYIVDRNFCTSKNLLDWHAKGSAFLVRRHASSLSARSLAPAHQVGKDHEGRKLSEEPVEVFEKNTGRRLVVRQITIHRTKKLGDLMLLTTLPPTISAARIAELYRERWTIERAFWDLTVNLGCEIDTLCYPKAALLGFAVALVAYNLWSVCRSAIAKAQGEKQAGNLSTYYLADEWQGTYRGMMIALPAECWARFRNLPADRLARVLVQLAGHLDPALYAKHPRGPKKKVKKTSGKTDHHFSVARRLAQAQKDGG